MAGEPQPVAAVVNGNSAAVENGDLPLRRFESWQRLQRELDRIAARQDARLRVERGREWTRRRDARRAR